jgi:hypothetical protein
MSQYFVCLFFLNDDKSPCRLFSGEINLIGEFHSYIGLVTEIGTEQKAGVFLGEAESPAINLEIGIGKETYQVRLEVVKNPAYFGSVLLGYSGVWYRADGKDTPHPAIASLEPIRIS